MSLAALQSSWGGVSGVNSVDVLLLGSNPFIIPLDTPASTSPVYNDISQLIPFFKRSGGAGGATGGFLIGLDFYKTATFPATGNVCFFLSDGVLLPTTGAPIVRVFNMGQVKPLENDPIVGDGVYSQYTFLQPISIEYILRQTGFTTLKLGCQWDGLDETGGSVAVGAVGVQPTPFNSIN